MQKFFVCSFAVLGLAFDPTTINAQTGSWSSPVLGYVYDPASKSVRTIGGVPGSASLDDAVPSPVKLDDAFVSSSRKFAIVRPTGQDEMLLLDWSTAALRMTALPGSAADATIVVFSPAGDSAAVFAKRTQSIQIWIGLPGNPTLHRETAGDVTALALADGGGMLIGTTTQGLLHFAEEPKTIIEGSYASLVFRPGSKEFAVFNRGTGNVTLFAEDFVPAVLGSIEASALEFSGDGRKLAAADAKNIHLIDLESRASSQVACDCAAGTLSRLQGNAVFRLTGVSDHPLFFLDGDAPEPRVFLAAQGASL